MERHRPFMEMGEFPKALLDFDGWLRQLISLWEIRDRLSAYCRKQGGFLEFSSPKQSGTRFPFSLEVCVFLSLGKCFAFLLPTNGCAQVCLWCRRIVQEWRRDGRHSAFGGLSKTLYSLCYCNSMKRGGGCGGMSMGHIVCKALAMPCLSQSHALYWCYCCHAYFIGKKVEVLREFICRALNCGAHSLFTLLFPLIFLDRLHIPWRFIAALNLK